MNPETPAQASQQPFNMADYVNIDLDDESSGTSSTVQTASHTSTSMTEPLQNLYTADTSNEDLVMTEPSESALSSHATYCDSIMLSPAPENLHLTDAFQTPIERVAIPDHSAVVQPVAMLDGVENGASEVQQYSSSNWVPVSSEMQRHLNMVYAAQIAKLSNDPNPPEMFLLPANGISAASQGPGIPSLVNEHPAGIAFSQTPHLHDEPGMVDPSLPVQGTGEMFPILPSSAGIYRQISPNADIYMPDHTTSTLTSLNKRALDPDHSDSEELLPKRIKTARELGLTVEILDPMDEDHMPMIQTKDEEEYDDEQDAEGEDDLDYVTLRPKPSGEELPIFGEDNSDYIAPAPNPKRGPTWRYEQAHETRLRHLRREE